MDKFTKSLYRRYLECRGEFWLKVHRPELVDRALEREEQFRIRQGYEVQRTAEDWLRAKDDREYVFQKTVETTDSLARLDAFVENGGDGGSWIFEIKSSNHKGDDSDGRPKRREQLQDLAFQVAVARESGVEVSRSFLITLDPGYVRSGPIEPDALFVTEDVTGEIVAMLPEISNNRADAFNVLAGDPQIDFGQMCTKKFECPFVRLKMPGVPVRNIGQIPRISSKKIKALADKDVFDLHDVPDVFELSVTQREYVETAKLSKPASNREAIRKVLGELVFPLYFLDYESVNVPVPLFDRMSPWQQIPFQYSLHVKESPESAVRHMEFVSDGSGIPPLELAKKLKQDIGSAGTVIVWNKSFEMTCNRQIGEWFPEFEQFFAVLNRRIFDLMGVFSVGLFRHPGIVNNSIKSVLPVIAPDLSYEDLEISKGDRASVLWYEDVFCGEVRDRKTQTLAALREYCGLDTMAMVRIFEELAKSVS